MVAATRRMNRLVIADKAFAYSIVTRLPKMNRWYRTP